MRQQVLETEAVEMPPLEDEAAAVAAADVTNRNAAQTALDQLEHARVKFIGAVLNRVDLEGNAYYYSKYYRKEYAGYYVATT